jgi:hypothetical protein
VVAIIPAAISGSVLRSTAYSPIQCSTVKPPHDPTRLRSIRGMGKTARHDEGLLKIRQFQKFCLEKKQTAKLIDEEFVKSP